jgi:hypothetical protein
MEVGVMAITINALTRPGANAPTASRSSLRIVGLVLGGVGLMLVAVSFINGLVAGNLAQQGGSVDQIEVLNTWSFGLTTAGFGTAKLGIGIVLLAIVRQLWIRVESVKAVLPSLVQRQEPARAVAGEFDSRYGKAIAEASPPSPLFIHRMAGLLWAPMLAMGAMLVLGGMVLSFVAASNVAIDPALARSQRAWVQGVQFLGEGSLLSGISFLLGTIAGAIRAGGGEIQQRMGLAVHTLRLPWAAKAFVSLMAVGLMVEVAQFFGYAYIATTADASTFAAASTWLGPLREFGLGMLLSGIVLALYTIALALGFQFNRVTEIITAGR